jgi:transcription elongation factor GreA
MTRYPMTQAGLKKLQTELKKLKSEDRPRVIEAIAEARGHGDISENAEYDAAKERQAFLEKRIREVEDHIAKAHVIDTSAISTEKVVFGVKVTVEDTDSGEKLSYQIVGEDEADAGSNRISVTSPIARALIGKVVGDVVRAQVPRGEREFEVLKIALP